MVAPTITHYYNTGTEAAPTWTDTKAVAGFSELRFTDDSKADMPIPPSGSDTTTEIWVIATADDEVLPSEDLVTADAVDKVLAWHMTNNDSVNDFTNVQLTIWDNANETGTTKAITNVTDDTVQMKAAATGWEDNDPGTGSFTSLGPWSWTAEIGGTTKINLYGSAVAGVCDDDHSCMYSENVNVDNTAVPGDNSHFGTISFDWT